MTDEQIRLECLKLAASLSPSPDDALKLAASFLAFVLGEAT
jgi:hypothetical protein